MVKEKNRLIVKQEPQTTGALKPVCPHLIPARHEFHHLPGPSGQCGQRRRRQIHHSEVRGEGHGHQRSLRDVLLVLKV